MESITGRAEHWRYGKAEWKKPDFAHFLPAPEHLSRAQKKIWEQRGYGLWIGGKIDILGEYHPLRNAEKEVLKSKIVSFLTLHDRKFFDALADGDSKKRDYDFIAGDNEVRATKRSSVLFDLVAGATDELPNINDTLDNKLAQTAGMFVRDCMRPYNAAINRDGIVADNLEMNLLALRSLNDKLLQIVDFPSGVYGVFSPVHSHKN